MANLAEIYDWFMTGKKPTQAQFWASWGSFWNKGESIPQTAISNLTTVLNAKAEKAQFDAHKTDENAHTGLFDAKEDKTQKGIAGGYVPLDEFVKIANEYLTIVNDLVTGGATSLASAETVKTLKTQIDAINTLLTSDNVNLDNVQEIVDAIETVQTSLSTILVNDLTTGGITKALTAEMGKLLDLAKENLSNKATIILEGTNESSNTLYPSVKAVYDWCVARFQKLLLNIETTAAIVYTLDYTNSAKRTVFTSANPVVVTIPTNSVSPIPVGARRELTAQGDGVVTIGGAGITFTTNLSLSMVKGETRILTKIATDTWTVEGNLPVAGALSYKTYFVNSLTGNNATGVYQDSNHPYATIDYVLALPALAVNDIIYLMDNNDYPLNGKMPDKSLTIRSDGNPRLILSGNNNANIYNNAGTASIWLTIDLPKGQIINEKSGGAGSYFGLTSGNLSIKINADYIYSNASNALFCPYGVIDVTARKTSIRSFLVSDGSLFRNSRFKIEEFDCLANGAYLVNSQTSDGAPYGDIFIGKISGTGSFNFIGGVYRVGDIKCVGTCATGGASLYLEFMNTTITSAGGFEFGSYYGPPSIITGTILDAPILGMTGNEHSYRIAKFINFSANIKAGQFKAYNAQIVMENCNIKSNGSVFTFAWSTNTNITLKNSTFEMVTPSALVTAGAGTTCTLKVAGISTNATVLSDQSGTGVTVTQFTNY